MPKKVIIVGGGVSGLACSYVFREYFGMDAKILEPNAIGGEFLAGGLKYVHYASDIMKLFDDLDLAYSRYQVRGGIMLRGQVEPYPKCLASLGKEQAQQIQFDHYRKTRRAEPLPAHAAKSMNDPASAKPRTALQADFKHLVDLLAGHATIIPHGLKGIIREANYIWTTAGKIEPYDYLVLTVPLWVIRECANWYVPHGVAMKLNIANIRSSDNHSPMSGGRGRYSKWDYVYTPYTPADAIHRFSYQGDMYSVEVNGDLREQELHSDLNFLFPDGWYVEDIRHGLKGHLLPLEEKIEWAENIAPLGRFAQWDTRATLDAVLTRAIKLAEMWY